MDGISPRRITFALTALAGVLLIGTIGFRWSLDESWLQSFYRSVVTSALLGLDTIPKNDSSRILSIFMVLAGVTIFAFVASTVVEGIAQGVLTGGLAEKRRRRAIDRLRDHYIICGYGRVGQRIGVAAVLGPQLVDKLAPPRSVRLVPRGEVALDNLLHRISLRR